MVYNLHRVNIRIERSSRSVRVVRRAEGGTETLFLKYLFACLARVIVLTGGRAKTEWTAEKRRLKEQTTMLEEAEQKAKDDLLRAMANSSQVCRRCCCCCCWGLGWRRWRRRSLCALCCFPCVRSC